MPPGCRYLGQLNLSSKQDRILLFNPIADLYINCNLAEIRKLFVSSAYPISARVTLADANNFIGTGGLLIN